MCLNFPTHKILYNLVERLSDFIQLNRCLFQSLPLFQQPQSIFHMLFLESWNVIVCKFILREHQLPGPVDHRDGKCELGKLGCWRVLLPDWNQLVCVVLQVRLAKPERVWPRHCINPASKSLVEDELRKKMLLWISGPALKCCSANQVLAVWSFLHRYVPRHKYIG